MGTTADDDLERIAQHLGYESFDQAPAPVRRNLRACEGEISTARDVRAWLEAALEDLDR